MTIINRGTILIVILEAKARRRGSTEEHKSSYQTTYGWDPKPNRPLFNIRQSAKSKTTEQITLQRRNGASCASTFPSASGGFCCSRNGANETLADMPKTMRRSVISTAKPILEKAIEDLVNEDLPSNVLTIADLGCAFGPNTFTVITTIKRKVEKRCNELGVNQPELQVFLNDLPGNDFNLTFKFFFENYQQLEAERIGEDGKKCFIAGAPGSFYERLFPLNSLHLVHSCYSAHWLSRVPPGLTSEVGIPINKGTIYISNTSPPTVSKVYLEQFQEGFTSFIKLRSKELIPNARMVLILHGRQGVDPSSTTCDFWELLSEALIAMVSEIVLLLTISLGFKKLH
ncbi:probable methyltransferase ICS2 [Telopea speciosissima]|uniref:probable methyltransferase ICS2 n=1 Tax=Telopea speciosissima TaxID=54955 RepID=UPI001CC543F0|nr:probable methyltransferase ICS2 [Telopea speciosissima]